MHILIRLILQEKIKRNSREKAIGKARISFTRSTEDKEYFKDQQRALVPEASLSSSSSSSIQSPKRNRTLPSKKLRGSSPVALNEKMNPSHYYTPDNSRPHRSSSQGRNSSSSSNSLDENALRPQKLYSSFIQQRTPTVFASSSSTAPLSSISTPQPSYEYLNI